MSDEELIFDLTRPAKTDACVAVSPLVRRVVAGNAGPTTFTGTCSYIVGRGRVAIVDPGPDDPEHIAALLAAVRHETVTHILVSHTHRDHSPAARATPGRGRRFHRWMQRAPEARGRWRSAR